LDPTGMIWTKAKGPISAWPPACPGVPNLAGLVGMMYNDDGIETMAERFLSFAAGEKRPRRFSFWN